MAKENKSETTKPQKCHTVICEPGSNKGTMRKPRLPPARSLEITECNSLKTGRHTWVEMSDANGIISSNGNSCTGTQ